MCKTISKQGPSLLFHSQIFIAHEAIDSCLDTDDI